MTPSPHFRCTDEQMAEIEARAKAAGYSKLSPYLRDRALSDGSAGANDSQAKAERVAGSTGSSVPVAEPPGALPRVVGAIPVDAGTRPGDLAPPPETREQYIERRTKALYGRGFTTRNAKTEAEREWREAHPDTEETE